MTSKEALENVIETLYDEWGYEGMKEEIKDILKPLYNDLDRFNELVKVIRILKKRKYAEWIKNKFYDGVSYDEDEEKLFKKVFGSSWRKY